MLSGKELNSELAQRYKLWLTALEYTVPTQHRYSKIIREFCDSLENKEISDTTAWDVRKFLIHESSRGLKTCSVYASFITLRSFFDFLSLGGILAQIPLKSIRMRSSSQNPPRVPSPETILRLLGAARNLRDAALVELSYATGCRVVELVNIKFGDIDFDSRKILVAGKNRKSRYVVFGAKAASAIRAYLGGRNSGYLFQSALFQRGCVYTCSRTETWIGEAAVYTQRGVRRRVVIRLGRKSELTFGEAWCLFKKRTQKFHITRPAKAGPMERSTISLIFRKLSLRAGITPVLPRTMRHCFATHMLDGGADIREIQELLGHVQLTSTQIYTHVSRKRLLETFDRCHPRGGGCDDGAESPAN